MLPSFILVLREGLEAALIIGILFATLRQLDRSHQGRALWIGVITAFVASFVGGIAIFVTIRAFEGPVEIIFEGSAYLLAVIVLTSVTFWMQKHSRTLKQEITTQIQSAGSGLALGLVAFTAVGREGIETALFLVASAFQTDAGLLIAGGLLGLLASIVLAFGVYRFGYRLNYRFFFLLMGSLLIIFAAGLLSNSIHEWQELGVLPIGANTVWDLSGLLSRESEFGLLLKGLLGYTDQPSLLQVIAYASYLMVAGGLFYWKSSLPKAEEARARTAPSSI
jgi:high-affinity iron transporter